MGWKFFDSSGHVKGVGASGPAGAAGSNKVTYIWSSKPVPSTGLGRRFYADRDITLSAVYAWVADTVPTGTLQVDLYLNGSSVFSSGYAQITSGNYLGSEKVPTTTAVVKGDKLEIYLNALGGASGRIGVAIEATYS